MKKYLISLDKDHHRRTLFFAQENTQDFHVFSACNTMDSAFTELEKRFNLIHFEQRYGRPATKGEVGCTLSHLGVYQDILQDTTISEEAFCLICEDDAFFQHDFQIQLNAILNEPLSCDLLLVGQSKIATFTDKELEINYPTTFSCCLKTIKGCEVKVCYPYKNYFAGTVAYLIRKSAVRRLLAAVGEGKLPYWLADDFILFGQQFQLDIQIVRPLMVIENPNLTSNLEAVRGSVQHRIWQKLWKYPFKKLLAIKRNLGK